MIRKRTNSITEKEGRDKQELFGHFRGGGVKADEWLKRIYAPSSFYYIRYNKIAKRFFDTEKSKKVLEIGSALGDFILFCSKNFPQHNYAMSDLSKKSFQKFSKIVLDFFKIPTSASGSIQYYEFSAESIPFADNTYDLIIIRSSVHHFENPDKAFGEIWRCLKPGGKLVFFNDPICINIPIIKNLFDIFFSLEGRAKGYNEHIYTIKDYLSFGKKFRNKEIIFDETYIEEFMKFHSKRKGLKKFISNIIVGNKRLFHAYLIYKYKAPIIFVFHK